MVYRLVSHVFEFRIKNLLENIVKILVAEVKSKSDELICALFDIVLFKHWNVFAILFNHVNPLL